MSSGQTPPPRRGCESKEPPARRRQYSREFKLAVIDECHARTNPELPSHERLSKYKIAHNFQITEKMLAEWLRNEDAIRLMQAGRKKITSVQYKATKSRSGRDSYTQYPVTPASYEQEASLYSSGSSHPHTPLHDILYTGETSSRCAYSGFSPSYFTSLTYISARPDFYPHNDKEQHTNHVDPTGHIEYSPYAAGECAQQEETEAIDEYDHPLQPQSYDPLYMYQSHISAPLVGTPYIDTAPTGMHEVESYWNVYQPPPDNQAWGNAQNPTQRPPWNGQ